MEDLLSHYFDSCIFSSFLNGGAEPENFQACIPIIRAAENKKIKVFTSAFTMAEVVYIKTKPDQEQLSLDKQERIITELFLSPWIQTVGFEPDMAEINRHLLRRFGKDGLKPYDSLHISTAIRMRVDYFDTIDQKLIDLLPREICCPPKYTKPVTIQRPPLLNLQMRLEL